MSLVSSCQVFANRVDLTISWILLKNFQVGEFLPGFLLKNLLTKNEVVDTLRINSSFFSSDESFISSGRFCRGRLDVRFEDEDFVSVLFIRNFPTMGWNRFLRRSFVVVVVIVTSKFCTDFSNLYVLDAIVESLILSFSFYGPTARSGPGVIVFGISPC